MEAIQIKGMADGIIQHREKVTDEALLCKTLGAFHS